MAQRIILELKDRLGAPVGSMSRPGVAPAAAAWRDQVHQGLTGLGWPAREADRAVDSVADQAGEQPRRRRPAARGPPDAEPRMSHELGHDRTSATTSTTT